MSEGPARRVAFIRAIGPLTHRVMPRPDLCKRLQRRGLRAVESVLATGNIFFTSAESATVCRQVVQPAIAAFGLSQDVFVRDAIALQPIVAACPFADAAEPRPSRMLVMVFDGHLLPDPLALLLRHAGPERAGASGHTLYVDYRDGVGASQPAPGRERRLKLAGTSRNWNTLLKSVEVLGRG